jgi:hypothetical protein
MVWEYGQRAVLVLIRAFEAAKKLAAKFLRASHFGFSSLKKLDRILRTAKKQ